MIENLRFSISSISGGLQFCFFAFNHSLQFSFLPAGLLGGCALSVSAVNISFVFVYPCPAGHQAIRTGKSVAKYLFFDYHEP
jgi:hypothetical protein|tara:strand:- start:84 stop:329 length:246 start_codon:yes stop_codon:yes gene_type:complete